MGQTALVDPNLDALIRHLAHQKLRASFLRVSNSPVPWLRPELDSQTQVAAPADNSVAPPVPATAAQWAGDLQSEDALIAMHAAFNTDKAEQALIDAFDPQDPGNSSDGIVLSLQIDYAAQAERAFRARTTQSFTRSLAHTSARDKGHGQPTGALIGMALDYFTHIIKQGSSGSGGAI